jgi:nitrate/nitrite transport system substrate-binding protein
VPWESDGYRPPANEFIDGVEFDARKPNAYIDKLGIGLKGNQKVEGGNVLTSR